MGYLSILFIAISLSFDSFVASVSSGLSLCRKSMHWSQSLKISISLAIVQGIMPVFGWYLGSTFKSYIEDFDHWIAFGLLCILGIHMIIDGRKPHGKIKNPTQWRVLIPMSIGTSIDALAVGVSFVFFIDNIWMVASIIATITFVISMAGLYMGRKAGKKLVGKAELLGGIVLIAIGTKILIEHLLAIHAEMH